MSDQSPGSMPPGWYPDTARAGFQRQWDGTQWIGDPIPLPGPKKGGFPKWVIGVFACLALGLVAVVGGAIAGDPEEEQTETVADSGEERSDEETTTTADGPGSADLARCNDGTFSDNPDPSAICSSHDGVDEWLAEYGECEDGTVIALRDDPECPNSGDLARLRPDYEPEAGPDDIALCNDGTYSDNRDLSATCSSHDGVDEWLAAYGRCSGGEVIELSGSPRCPGGDDLAELLPDYVPPTTTAPPATTTPPAPPVTAPPTTADPFAGETVSQANARRSAAQYLEFQAFSRQGLIEQLEFEGFSNADATYGVDAQNADWNEQAAKSAAQYLEFQAFSRQGLIDQLIFEGFTPAEAEYGVSTTGL